MANRISGHHVSPGMDRRDFLRAAALTPLATTFAAPAPDWRGLHRALTGKLVRPGDAGYDVAKRLFNPVWDRISPAGVAYCATPADVSACLTFAHRSDLAVTPRSGGHSFAGWSTTKGLVVDVSKMNGVSYAHGRATVGAGASLIEVYDKLADHGVSIPAGTCPSVGIGGLTLGGGFGVVSRKYGLTCDTLESVRIVTADGRLLTCDATHHADLYWACRGGGGGNVGVAVGYTFRTHPARNVTVFFLHWQWERASAAVKAWQSWASTAPDGLWSTLHLKRENGSLDVQIGGLFLGGAQECERLLAPLVSRIGPVSTRYVKVRSYRAAMRIMASCSTTARCVEPRAVFNAKSHLAYRELTAEGIFTLVAGVAREGGHAVLLDALGGRIGRVAPDATAFPHREALYNILYYSGGSDRYWLDRLHTEMNPHFGDHAYVNCIDPGLPNWRQAYYGGNAPRLAAVKSTYDPTRLFDLPQGY